MTSVNDLFAAYSRLTVAAHPSVTDTHDGDVCVTVVGHGWPSTCAAVGRGPDRPTAHAEALAMLARPLAYLRAVDAVARHLRAVRVLAAYHACALACDRATAVAAERPSPETRAARDVARFALYRAEREAYRAL